MKKLPGIVRKIVEAIRASNTFCIVGHIRPDGDCIGSQLGLGLALKAGGKKVTCWNEDSMPAKLAFLDLKGRLLQQPVPGRRFDCVIATDCASFERLGKVGPCIERRNVFINIDHHASNTRYADLNWISPEEPSTGELIWKFDCHPVRPKGEDKVALTYFIATPVVAAGCHVRTQCRVGSRKSTTICT